MTMLSGRRMGALMGLALAAALALAACGTGAGNGGYGAYGAPPANTSGGGSVPVNLKCDTGAAVCSKQVSLGGKATTVLANAQGMTLYFFDGDSASSSACTGACAQTWPALTVTGSSVTGTASVTGTLATLSDPNGQQVTYNGHPLYHYAGDQAQTDANGDGLEGKWHAAYPGLIPASTGGSGYGSGY